MSANDAPRPPAALVSRLSRRIFWAQGAAFLLGGKALAQPDPCTRYYGNGYCTDYVNQKIGKRIRGDAASWPANIQRIAVQAGDVAIFRRINHVAYIEAVTERGTMIPYAPGKYPTQLRISEWNYGPRDTSAPRECLVTTKFGQVTTRTGAFSDAEFMRP
jgi:hypothetical protein